eukprot:3840923-Alexandrium_andersonii.AAC.1
MSASLVGSEMCIRDSNRTMRQTFGQGPVADARTPPKSRAGNARNTAETVSYTHLTLPTICSV